MSKKGSKIKKASNTLVVDKESDVVIVGGKDKRFLQKQRALCKLHLCDDVKDITKTYPIVVFDVRGMNKELIREKLKDRTHDNICIMGAKSEEIEGFAFKEVFESKWEDDTSTSEDVVFFAKEPEDLLVMAGTCQHTKGIKNVEVVTNLAKDLLWITTLLDDYPVNVFITTGDSFQFHTNTKVTLEEYLK
jgi:hypothetical protein